VEHHRQAAAPRALQPDVERPRAPRRRPEEAVEGMHNIALFCTFAA